MWVNAEDGGDVIDVESFDGAYAVVHSQKWNRQMTVNGAHFGRRYQLLPDSASNEPETWYRVWIKPAAPVDDEQCWIAGIDAALHRGGKGFVVQTAPPHDTSYDRQADGYELRILGDESAHAEVLRALPSFDPAGTVTASESHP